MAKWLIAEHPSNRHGTAKSRKQSMCAFFSCFVFLIFFSAALYFYHLLFSFHFSHRFGLIVMSLVHY